MSSSKKSIWRRNPISRLWRWSFLSVLKRLDAWQLSSSEPDSDEMDVIQFDPYLEEVTKLRKKG